MKRLYQALVPASTRAPLARWRYNSASRFLAPWYAATDPRFRNRRRLLAEMGGEFAGQRCVIMGNGPSLNRMELSRFKSEQVWASNRAYLLFDRISWRPAFWVGVDRRVIPDTADELMQVQHQLPETRFFYPDHFLLTGRLGSLGNTYWFRERREPDDGSHFSLSPHKYVSSVSTVTITALQLAVFLGFNPIYLIGCDTSYSKPKSTTVERGNDQRLISTADNDPNHFDPRYFGAGRKWHEPHVERMVDHYQRVREVTKGLGVEVLNATVGGNLEVFPRIDYRKAFAK